MFMEYFESENSITFVWRHFRSRRRQFFIQLLLNIGKTERPSSLFNAYRKSNYLMMRHNSNWLAYQYDSKKILSTLQNSILSCSSSVHSNCVSRQSSIGTEVTPRKITHKIAIHAAISLQTWMQLSQVGCC